MYPGSDLWAIRRCSLEIVAWLRHASKGDWWQIHFFLLPHTISVWWKSLAKQMAGMGECGSGWQCVRISCHASASRRERSQGRNEKQNGLNVSSRALFPYALYQPPECCFLNNQQTKIKQRKTNRNCMQVKTQSAECAGVSFIHLICFAFTVIQYRVIPNRQNNTNNFTVPCC